MSAPTSSGAVVRPVQEADIDGIVALLRREFSSRLAATALRRLFDYRWCEALPDRGFVVASDGEVAGFLGTIYSRRAVGGATVPVMNLSCWYVRPAFRSLGLPLLIAALARRDHVVTSLSPNPLSGPIYRRLGFTTLSRGFTLLSPRVALRRAAAGLRIVTNERRIEQSLDEASRRVLHDHSQYRCGHYLIDAGGACSYVITKRRQRGQRPRLPVSEILFASDTTLAAAYLGPLMRAILVRERSLAVAVDEMVLGKDEVQGLWRPRERLFKAPPGAAPPRDSLYSEMVLLD